ncbi:unnamed protein product [Adineta steineri]|uniref:Uncharacterized protein n=1 Tax=Adineta steineri TaxID=433720 RepID=A0A816D7B1_9BILA|nr:unnamed protein product [Adineta steineri]CAF1633496.1 unnamed protein product [Adineta steineri]
MGNCFPGGTASLIRLVAFDYEVNENQVTVVSQIGDRGQGIYQVTIRGITTPIRYDRVGSVYMRHASAPPLPHEVPGQATPTGKPSNHGVIKYAAADNQVPTQSVTMIKMSEEIGSGTYHLNVKGNRMIYKKMGTSFMKAGSFIPGTNTVV